MTAFSQIDRLKEGNPGQGHGVGGISELKIDFGPGYRVYYAIIDDNTLILLLAAGDKSDQQKDIITARTYYSDFLSRRKKGEPI